MKKLLLAVLLILFTLPLAAQVVLFEDDFESGLGTGWTLVSSSTSSWALSTSRSHSPSTSLSHPDDWDGPHDDWAIYGPISLPGFIDGLEIAWWEYTAFTSYYTYHGLYISTTDPTSDPLATMTEVDELSDVSSSWLERTRDLESYASGGDDIWIAFRYNESYDTEWYVDDISVTVSEPPAIVEGNVNKVDVTDNGGVNVSTFGDAYTTVSVSPSGDYTMEVAPGTYDGVYAHLAGWFPDSNATPFTLASGETYNVDLEIEAAPYVYVTGHADLVPTPGADAGITIYSSTGGTVETEADGSFELAECEAGHIVIYGEEYGYFTESFPPFDAEPGDSIDLDTLFLNYGDEGGSCEDFESDDGGFISSAGWDWGTPSSGPSAAHSGTNCWGTNIAGDYDNNADWVLQFDLTASPLTTIESITWWQWYETESYFDAGIIDLSTDGGSTWERVTPTPGYDGTTSTSIAAYWAGDDAFSGSGTSWTQVEADLTSYPDVTHINWHFGSDGSVNWYPGWYIDDVCLTGEMIPPEPPAVGNVDGYVYDNVDYVPIEGALVMVDDVTTFTDEDGYFMLEDVRIGMKTVGAHKTGYFPGFADAAINEFEDVTVYIPMSPVQWTPGGDDGVDVEIAYDHEDSAAAISFCNTSNDTVVFNFSAWGSDFGEESGMGDVIEEIDILGGGLDTPWGLGLIGIWETDKYWITDIGGTCYIREYNRDGSLTGRYFDALDYWPSITFIGDMAWDGDGLWLLQVGGTNAMYKVDPVSLEIVDSLYDATPDTGWGSVSQRGLVYDPVEDVFYTGGWNSDKIYKVKGKSWDVPGDEIGEIDADGCAGVAFHPGRRTVWYAANADDNQIFEVDFNTGTVLNTLDVPPETEPFALAGLEIDGEGKIWYTAMEVNKVYILDSGYGILPGGIYFDPYSGTLAPDECVDIMVRTAGHSAQAGIHDFDGYLEYDPEVPPLTIPITLSVSPTIDYGWNMISVPVDAIPNDPWAQLHDDITPFSVSETGSDILGWYAVDGRYTVPGEFERGEGYYLWSNIDDNKFDVYGEEYVDDYTIELTYNHDAALPGWQVIGNPINRRVDWDDVVADPAFHGIDETVWYYSTTSGWATYTPGFAGGLSNEIDPYLGWWVKLDDETASIPFKADYALESFAKGVKFDKESSDESLEDIVLRVSATATSDGIELNDMWNYLATTADAIDDTPLDDYDHEEMSITPPGGTVLKASFVQGTSRLKDEFKSTFTTGETKTWNMNVTDLSSGDRVTLAWPRNTPTDPADGSFGVLDISEDYTLTVEHPGTGEMIDMREDTSITFIYNGSTTVNFTIAANMLDADEQNIVPETYALEQNTPNPFNATTSFSVSLKEDCDAEIAIYNTLGEKVKTIANGSMDAGVYNYTWYGKNDSGDDVSTGVYLYKVETKDFTDVRRMILMK
ncbi:MAG: FlgD immunoglobulin-like domain containing protein [Candidatus Zixiibacteriota bacterium]